MLEQEISTEQDKMLNADRFLKIVDKYTDMQDLTPEILQEFNDRIVVHGLRHKKSRRIQTKYPTANLKN